MNYNMNEIVGKSDIVFLTLDTLRYDVAQNLWNQQKLPNFSKWLSKQGWEKRHTPGNFTYAAHQAFFAGFLPTPIAYHKQARLFAAKFAGSETTLKNTYVFTEENIVAGLHASGYKTICIGGVGFFNKQTALSSVFPAMFEESYWEESYGVTSKNSSEVQFKKATELLQSYTDRVFLFINISALHQPNYFYLPGGNNTDDLQSHAAALQYVDSQLPILMQALAARKQTFVICCSDHGTTYGEDGFTGHRIGHEKVWDVPYLEILL
ncbi:MAG: STM4013/SEN3800 family hydrolase [Spirochaetota bacterium]